MEETKLKRISKAEFAKSLGIGHTTLRIMLNEFAEELAAVGYRKTQKYLTRAQVEILEALNINKLKQKY